MSPLTAGQRAVRIWAASAIVVVSLLLTLTRLPTLHADGPFYASIVRGAHYGTYGIPSALDPQTATGINHIRFYGPVYFTLVDVSFALFGLSIGAYRAISLAGVLLAAGAGVWICKVLGGGPERRAWTWVLLLLTPEAGTASSSGRMDSLAVGLELCALAVFLNGLTRRERPWLHGTTAAALLCAAVLTTPRTFPFMVGFALAMLFVLPREMRDAPVLKRQAVITGTVAAAIMLAWTLASSGSPMRWFRLMATVALREDTDVAVLPGAAGHRDLMFVWWQAITLVFSVLGAIVAGILLGRDRSARGIAMRFGLVATWTTLVATMTLFNFTFLFGIYSVIPLTALVIAVPTPLGDLRRRGAALVAVMLFGLLVGIRAAKVAHAAITWEGRDIGRVEAFVSRNVPPGSRVLGPGYDYFLPVERAGSRYLSVPQVSLADWARWMQVIEPRQLHPAPLTADFLIWRASDPPPRAIACPARLVDTYDPPPPTLPSLAWAVDDDPFNDYPRLHLYALGGSCGV